MTSSTRSAVTVPSPTIELTAGQARRVAIAAQQLARPARSAATVNGAATSNGAVGRAVNRGHLKRLLHSIGLLQIDSVNVLARSHLIPIFSRLGPYPTSLLETAAWPARAADRLLIEAWAHEASLIPIQMHPLFRWRQRKFAVERWNRVERLRRDHPGFLDTVLAVIAELGPSSAGDIERALEAPSRGVTGWWEWSITKTACEFLFATGEIAVAFRRGFERCYDLTEHVLPPAVANTPTPDEADAKRALTALAARSHGVGTAADLADYYRIGVADAKAALRDLSEEGVVIAARVDGWRETAYLHRDARVPRAVTGAALLCPFDPLIWERRRTERLFDFHFRIEIYTPAQRRRFGYYVCPLLVGDRIVGRFDLKADRPGSRLLVQASWVEPGADPGVAADAAATELARMARWLALDEIAVQERGDLWKDVALRTGSLPG